MSYAALVVFFFPSTVRVRCEVSSPSQRDANSLIHAEVGLLLFFCPNDVTHQL